jgi:hypothetical protein
VTFNFDSVIEHRLAALIGAAYAGESADDIAKAIAAVRVIHVHGQLPPIPTESIGDEQNLITYRGSPRTEPKLARKSLENSSAGSALAARSSRRFAHRPYARWILSSCRFTVLFQFALT